VVGLVCLICLTGVVLEILPSHFFVRNFSESEVSQLLISIIYFQNFNLTRTFFSFFFVEIY
jgi:hypothetical protein